MSLEIEAMWSSLSDSIQSILRNERKDLSFIDLHNLGYQITKQGHGNYLYNKVKDLFKFHNRNIVVPQICNSNSLDFLTNLRDTFSTYISCTSVVADILMYLERRLQYPRKIPCNISPVTLPTIYQTSLNSFRDSVFSPEIRSLCTESLLFLITEARNNQTFPKSILMDSLDTLNKLSDESVNIYRECFVNPLTLSIIGYCEDVTRQAFDQNSMLSYFSTVEKVYKYENLLFTKHLHLNENFGQIYITEFFKPERLSILDSELDGIVKLCSEHRHTELGNIFNFLDKINSSQEIFISHLCKRLELLEKNLTESKKSENDSSIEILVECKKESKRLKAIVQTGNYKDAANKLIENTFCSFVAGVSNFYFKFSSHLNNLIANHSIPEAEFHSEFLSALELISFVDNLDSFEVFYRKQMSERYLKQSLTGYKQMNTIRELFAVTEITKLCGHCCVEKITRLYNDVANSCELNRKFEHNGLDSFISVFTKDCWFFDGIYEFKPTNSFPILPSLQSSFEEFTKFYKSSHKLKELVLIPDLCVVQLDLVLTNGSCLDVKCSLPQAMVLNCFMESSRQIFSSLCKSFIQILPLCLQDILYSMTRPGRNILLLENAAGDVIAGQYDKDTVFVLNDSFEGQKINLLPDGMYPPALIQNQKSVVADSRFPAISDNDKYQCFIVRNVKTAKRLKHSTLSTRFFSKFPKSSESDFKEEVEKLISKSYIERDSHKHNVYVYSI